MKTNNFIKVETLDEIDTDQLIWDIENSKDFFIYEIDDNEDSTNILVKIICKDNY